MPAGGRKPSPLLLVSIMLGIAFFSWLLLRPPPAADPAVEMPEAPSRESPSIENPSGGFCRQRGPIGASLALAQAGPLQVLPALALEPEEPRVRLVVLVVFDQMRADYLTRWQHLFAEDGFRRLQQEGAWFQNCHYPYATTLTAAGHASLLTGCSPQKHGIIGNDWYERRLGQSVYCVWSERHRPVPSIDGGLTWPIGAKTPGAVSPERLLAPSLGDVLKQATSGQARVTALSLKDRSAVLPGGARPDACYWLDTATGSFITSTYYRKRLHPWVEELNRSRYVDRWCRRAWAQDPPRASNEGTAGGTTGGRTLPERPGMKYYLELYSSPFGNELLLELAKRAIDAQELGRGPVPDLLSVSFSSNDAIGHRWGPDSPEVLDVTLRSDVIVKELLTHLDAKVGRGRYLLALSADHGVCPAPETIQARGEEAGRVSIQLLASQAGTFLQETFGKPGPPARWIEAAIEPWIYLNRELLRERRLDPAQVEAALAAWLVKQTGVQAVYTRTQLEKGPDPNDPISERVCRSFHPERSGDALLVLKPFYIFGFLPLFATHGSPHAYDTHVPLLVYGPGVPGGIYTEAVTPQAVTPIFARALGVPPPSSSDTPLPKALLVP